MGAYLKTLQDTHLHIHSSFDPQCSPQKCMGQVFAGHVTDGETEAQKFHISFKPVSK